MTINNELISVIIPAYNHSQYVQEAIKSVLDQTYSNIELIVIDDGSNDETWLKINEMRGLCEQRFKRVVFETQKNKGICLTLNKLLDLSKGEYIQLCASDDKLSPDAIHILYDFLSVNPAYALAVGKNLFMDAHSVVCYWDKHRNNVYKIEEAKYPNFTSYLENTIDFETNAFGSYESLLPVNYIPNGYLIRKNIFEKIGYFTPEAPLEDYWLMLQIAKYAKMKYIDLVTFYYRWHGANTASQDNKMMLMLEKTKEYELKLVESLDNSLFNKKMKAYLVANTQVKTLLKIPFMLEIYKEKLWEKKWLILKVFTIKLILKFTVKK